MSAKGCGPDDAAAEGFFGRLKQEFFHGRGFTGVTIEGFIERLDEYMTWYRDGRIKLAFGTSIAKRRREPDSWHNQNNRTTRVQQNVTTPNGLPQLDVDNGYAGLMDR